MQVTVTDADEAVADVDVKIRLLCVFVPMDQNRPPAATLPLPAIMAKEVRNSPLKYQYFICTYKLVFYLIVVA